LRTHQNMELHSSAKARELILKADVNWQVEEEFLGGSCRLPRDAVHLLQQPKEQVMRWQLTTKQQWLDSIAAAQCQLEQMLRDPMAGE